MATAPRVWDSPTVKCVLSMARELKSLAAAMDRDKPGWADMTILCPGCRDDHVIISGTKQLQLVPGEIPDVKTRRSHLPPLKPGAPEGWCRWHETASPELAAPCAWETCRTPVHVHQDALGQVKSGAAGKGYLVQRCPACHRYNAVHPVYGKKGTIRTSKLDGATPVLQMAMRTG